ncbi:hypothetical protein RIF29_29713 [Crotalaria pallida]|uniref:RING-type E3 ubiquitin transferase n=1 Tax=Crotalaria pallida TaxID=3830 RepID=A0AAN9EF98_CROPI
MGSVTNSNNPFAPNSVFKDCSQGICSIYCPQWCYIIYSPPPPSINDLDDDDSSTFQFSPLIVAVIGILASTFILVTYYTIISRFCRHSRRTSNDPNASQTDHEDGVINNDMAQVSTSGLDETLIKSITVCKYKRNSVLVDGSDCSVCLSEFQENESLRLLPKCNHAFHIPCIDPWLKSHSSCPLCRSDINSTITDPNHRDGSSILIEAPASMNMNMNTNMNALEYQQRSDDVVIVIVQSSDTTAADQLGVVSFRGEEVLPKRALEAAADDNDNDDHGENENNNIEQLDVNNLTRVSVRDILNDNEHDEELQREGSDIGSSRGAEGEQGEENGKSGVVNMVKRCASTGRSMFTRYGSIKGMNSVLPN